MKVLFINASPRHGGNIDTLLSIMNDKAKALGHNTECVRTDQLHFAPCHGCMACRSKGNCVLPTDDAQRVLELIRWCDAIVVGAPCYWGNMPGHLKMLFDRMVYGMMGENRFNIPTPKHKGKRALVVTACTTRWPFNLWFNQTRGVVRALHEIFKYSGFKLARSIQVANTKGRKAVNNRTLARAQKAIVRLTGGQADK